MIPAEINQHPIQILFNYWEVRPTMMGARLDDFIRHGISHIATFIPWQAVESDISHTLVRFLQAAADRKMTVNLILSPEVGLHYPNSGLPKDVMGREDNVAQHVGGGPIAAMLPPNCFNLPSLFAPEFSKRYYSFLSRMDGMLASWEKNSPAILHGVTVTLTGSYWKYYRSPEKSSKSPFAGIAGDCSGAASLAYRQGMEQCFAQREFADPNPMAANRWKTRSMEEVNRRWFHQQSEDVFRNRSYQNVRKKGVAVKVREYELHTPEADPSMSYNEFLMMLAGGHGDFARLSTLVDECAARASHASASRTMGYIHWTGLGPFHGLADPEKQFLILKSLLLMGGRGGGILIDDAEWFSLSQGFRTRVESFAKSLSHGDLRLRNRAIYLAPHLWSGAGTLWNEMLSRVGAGARMISSLDYLTHENEASLVIVDPSWILTRDSVKKLTAWAKEGRVVVMPRSPLYTEAARRELEQTLAQTKRIEIDLGVPYRLHALGEGKVIIYEMLSSEALSSWQTFLTAVLSVAEVHAYCRMGDSRLAVIPLEKKGEGLGLFVLNSTRRAVAADIIFQGDVAVSDLAVSLSNSQHMGASARGSAKSTPASRFALDVPPCGILPLAVDGIEIRDEKRIAAENAEVTRNSADHAALSELPGYDPSKSTEGLWN